MIEQIPIFVINLPTSIERRSAIEKDAERLNIKLSIIDAIDGRLIKDHSDLGYSKKQIGKSTVDCSRQVKSVVMQVI